MIWLTAIRPKTLAASICPVLLGSVMAITQGSFNWIIAIFTLLTALGIQISCNLINDYQDFIRGADTLKREGPLRVTAMGLVSIAGMKKASLISLSLTALCGTYLIAQGGYIIAILLTISLLLAAGYTAGPLPLAYMGTGELFVITFFGPIAVSATYFLQMHHFSIDTLIAGLALGAISTAILVANNLRDEMQDRLAAKKTLVVRFGTLFGKCEYCTCILLAVSLPFYFLAAHPFSLIASLTLLPASFTLHTLFTTNHFATVFFNTARLLLLYTVLFCIGWML